MIQRLILGSANFGNTNYGITNNSNLNFTSIKNILNFIKKKGIKKIDTAINYGNAQKNIGKVNNGYFKITSKLPRIPNNLSNIENWIEKKISLTLDELNTNCLEGLLFHDSAQLFEKNGEKIFSIISKIKKEKKIKKIGFSIYSPLELKKISQNYDFDIIQIPLNIFDQRFLNKDLIKQMKKKKCEIQARSIFLQGLLLVNTNKLPINFLKWKYSFDKWNNWLINNNIDNITAALKFVLQIKEIDNIIISCQNVDQLKKILKIEDHNVNKVLFPSSLSNFDEKLINPQYWQN